MAKLKTQINDGKVTDFLKNVENEKWQTDSYAILDLMKEVTGEEPKMWGTSIIGFGSYHYKYESGREGDWFTVGFSPRKQNLSLYIMSGFSEYDALLAKLGKHKTGKSCLYVNKIEDVDQDVLKALIKQSVAHVKATYKS